MNFIKDWGLIAGIAGIGLTVFIFLFKAVLSKVILSKLSSKQSTLVIVLFMLLVASVSIYCIYGYFDNKGEPYSITVLVHGPLGKDQLILPGRGVVELIYGDAPVNGTINEKGEVTFKQIPAEFFDKKVPVEIQFSDPLNEPYKVTRPDSFYTLTRGRYISLEVKLFGLNQIKGIVKNWKTGYPLDSVRISITGAYTYSNNFGEYNLSIPTALQKKYQTVRAIKKGFESFEMQNIPIQTEGEFPILMKPTPSNK